MEEEGGRRGNSASKRDIGTEEKARGRGKFGPLISPDAPGNLVRYEA